MSATSAQLLTVGEAAQRLRKAPRFVLDELRKKNLRGAKFGGEWHIDPADLQAYVESKMNVSRVRRAS